MGEPFLATVAPVLGFFETPSVEGMGVFFFSPQPPPHVVVTSSANLVCPILATRGCLLPLLPHPYRSRVPRTTPTATDLYTFAASLKTRTSYEPTMISMFFHPANAWIYLKIFAYRLAALLRCSQAQLSDCSLPPPLHARDDIKTQAFAAS